MRAVGGRLHAVFAHLGVAENIFHDHDRVVDDEADGQRQAEQRECIEREAREIMNAMVPSSDIGIASKTFKVLKVSLKTSSRRSP